MDQMEQEILDVELTEKNKNPKVSINKWFVLAILWIGIAFCFTRGLFYDIQVLFSISLLILATIANFRNHKFELVITLAIIVLGMFNLAHFFPFEVTFSIFFLKFNPLLFLLALVHFFLNKNSLGPQIQGFLGNSPQSIQEESDSRVNGFKHRFSQKSEQELEEIINSEMIVAEAKKAAEELLIEKYKTDQE
ncbi:MAG: hypothetical protein DWQ02_28675 [Bacteroidetes bacterium]|nr:MAG: hypothetical protein DWQ02_28675 [Bacteroidota bacterium]